MFLYIMYPYIQKNYRNSGEYLLTLLIAVIVFFNCSNNISINPPKEQLESLKDYGLNINEGDIYHYSLKDSYFGPNLSVKPLAKMMNYSNSYYITYIEESMLDVIIGTIYRMSEHAQCNVSIHARGFYLFDSLGHSPTDTVRFDRWNNGYIEVTDTSVSQHIDGLFIDFFYMYIGDTSNPYGIITVGNDTLHYKKRPSIFDSNLAKQQTTSSSWFSASFFILENAMLLERQIQIASGLINQNYSLILVSINYSAINCSWQIGKIK